MTEQEWETGRNIFEMYCSLDSKAYSRKWDLFCCACLKRVWSILVDPSLRAYVEAKEQFADGCLQETEVEAVWDICADAFRQNDRVFPFNWFAQAFTEQGVEFDPYNVATACSEAVGVVVAESLRPNRDSWTDQMSKEGTKATDQEEEEQHRIRKDIFGNPFRPVAFDPKWRTEHTVGIAAKMYDEREFAAMPILADALEEAGCDNQDILLHCRKPGVHVRGCWVVDLVLGK